MSTFLAQLPIPIQTVGLLVLSNAPRIVQRRPLHLQVLNPCR
ncbi:MAG: hypothetical protein NTW15_13040 [Burkholderiales bacterium]|nr:hypothetical protein [Burkholderiales bacterium]